MVVTAVDKLESGVGPGRRSDRRRCDPRGAHGRPASHRHRRHDVAGARSAPRSAAPRFWSRSGSSRRRPSARSTSRARICSRATTRSRSCPGSIKVREGQPVTVTARIPGISGGLVPMITVGRGDAARSARMSAGANAGRIHDHAEQHHGVVSLRGDRGIGAVEGIQVDVIRPVRVSRIDLKYEYAPGVGLRIAHRRRRRRHLRSGRNEGGAHDHDRQAGRARPVDDERWQRRSRCTGTTRC